MCLLSWRREKRVCCLCWPPFLVIKCSWLGTGLGNGLCPWNSMLPNSVVCCDGLISWTWESPWGLSLLDFPLKRLILSSLMICLWNVPHCHMQWATWPITAGGTAWRGWASFQTVAQLAEMSWHRDRPRKWCLPLELTASLTKMWEALAHVVDAENSAMLSLPYWTKITGQSKSSPLPNPVNLFCQKFCHS